MDLAVVTLAVGVLRREWLENKMAPDVTLAEGEPEEDVVGKQDGAGSNRDVGVPEEEVVGKQEGAGSSEPTEGLRKTWLQKKMAR